MKTLRHGTPLFLILLWIIPLVFAQEDTTCPTIVQIALESTDQSCQDTGRNQACYGNVILEAEPKPAVREFAFSEPGDIADAIDIQSLHLSALDTTQASWGIVLMKLQANLPDTLPGQNVTFLFFGDVEMVEATQTTENPWQAFTFQSGIGDAVCTQSPESGLLIQTPEEADEVILQVNEVAIRLGSTVYLQAQADEVLIIHVLEGQAVVMAFDVTRVAPAGSRVTVPLDQDLHAAGPPHKPEPYAIDAFPALPEPIRLLPRDITIAQPLTEAEIAAFESEMESGAGRDCTVTAGGNINIRSGPGTHYTVSGQITGGASRDVNGQAAGSDGFTWWQLGDGEWVRSDVVTSAGNCDTVILIIDLPATPVPVQIPPATNGSGESFTKTFTVSGNVPWITTGINVQAGQSFSINTSGTTNSCILGAACPEGYDQWVSATGIPGNTCSDCPVIGVSEMALIAQVGSGQPFLVGTGGTFTASDTGVLKLGINDAAFEDNGGSYQVTVHVAGTSN